MTDHQLGRKFRQSWINAVRRYHLDLPHDPNPTDLLRWDEMVAWEQCTTQATATRLTECIRSARNGARKLYPDEQSQLVTALWNAHVHCFHPDPGPSHITPWRELPTWRRNVNIDIFEDLTAAAGDIVEATPDPELVRGLQRMLVLHRSGPHYTATVTRCADYWEIEIDNLGTIHADLSANHRDTILAHARNYGHAFEDAHVFIHYPTGATT